MTKTSELAEFIHSELQQGKTIAQIKKDVKQRSYGWEPKDISKAIHEAVQKELKQRKPTAVQSIQSAVNEISEVNNKTESENETKNIETGTTENVEPSVNQVWMWATITAVLAIIVVTAVILYFVR